VRECESKLGERALLLQAAKCRSPPAEVPLSICFFLLFTSFSFFLHRRVVSRRGFIQSRDRCLRFSL
jgi:hypothetical protein